MNSAITETIMLSELLTTHTKIHKQKTYLVTIDSWTQ